MFWSFWKKIDVSPRREGEEGGRSGREPVDDIVGDGSPQLISFWLGAWNVRPKRTHVASDPLRKPGSLKSFFSNK